MSEVVLRVLTKGWKVGGARVRPQNGVQTMIEVQRRDYKAVLAH